MKSKKLVTETFLKSKNTFLHIKKCANMQDNFFFKKIRTLREATRLKTIIFWEYGLPEGFILYDTQRWCFCFSKLLAARCPRLMRAPVLSPSPQTVKPSSEGSSAYCVQHSLASQQQTPEWGGHAYLCQHVLLITRKTTKYTAIIT